MLATGLKHPNRLSRFDCGLIWVFGFDRYRAHWHDLWSKIHPDGNLEWCAIAFQEQPSFFWMSFSRYYTLRGKPGRFNPNTY